MHTSITALYRIMRDTWKLRTPRLSPDSLKALTIKLEKGFVQHAKCTSQTMICFGEGAATAQRFTKRYTILFIYFIRGQGKHFVRYQSVCFVAATNSKHAALVLQIDLLIVSNYRWDIWYHYEMGFGGNPLISAMIGIHNKLRWSRIIVKGPTQLNS